MEKKNTGLELYGKNKFNVALFAKSTLSEEEKTKVREYAKLAAAKEAVIRQIKSIEKMIMFVDAKWCSKHLWMNGKAEAVPIFDIEDSYLKNIVNWHQKNHKPIPKEIQREYFSRFGFKDLGDAEPSEYQSLHDEDLFSDDNF